MSDQLRPRPVPAPPPAAGQIPANMLPGDGRPPLRVGSIGMSDFTRRQLESVGWRDGDPIPGDLGQRLQALQQEVLQEQETAKLENSELAAGWKPVQANFVEITSLPPEKQAEIREYLQEYKQQVAEQKQLEEYSDAVEAQIPPNIQGEQRDRMREQLLAGNAAMAAYQQRRASSSGAVIDDRQTATVAATSPPPEPQPATAATGQPTPPVHTPEADHIQNCPRCTWDVSRPFEIVPTEEDKRLFIASILGSGRFEKRYDLLGGRLQVYFRTLTSQEAITLNSQLSAMVRAGTSRGDAEYLLNLIEFKLVMSVSRIVAGGNTVYTVDSLHAWASQHPPEPGGTVHPTDIPRLREYFYTHGATQEPLRRIIGDTFTQFQKLDGMLEEMTSDPDFFKGIDLHD